MLNFEKIVPRSRDVIDFLRKNKDLKEIFEKAEQRFAESRSQKPAIVAKNVEEIEEITEENSTHTREFYEIMCEEFCENLISKDMKYDESLIKVNIQFNKGELGYRICFPLIETSESNTQVFVQTLKDSIKKHVSSQYSVNLCLQKDDETHNVILILERVKSTHQEKENKRENFA